VPPHRAGLPEAGWRVSAQHYPAARCLPRTTGRVLVDVGRRFTTSQQPQSSPRQASRPALAARAAMPSAAPTCSIVQAGQPRSRCIRPRPADEAKAAEHGQAQLRLLAGGRRRRIRAGASQPGRPAARSGPAAGGSARPLRRARLPTPLGNNSGSISGSDGPARIATASPTPRASTTTGARSQPGQRGTDGIRPTCTGFTRWPRAGPRYPAPAGAGPRAGAAHTACGSPR
jgi:hypothetical protein